MTSPAESKIALLTTDVVRTLTITTLIDGVPTDVKMQVIAIADADGNVVDAGRWREEMLGALRSINSAIERLNETTNEGLRPRRGRTAALAGEAGNGTH